MIKLSKKELQLSFELLRLLNLYGEKTFLSVANKVEKGAFALSLRSISQGDLSSFHGSDADGDRIRNFNTKSINHVFRYFEERNVDVYRSLVSFYGSLQRVEVLESLSDIREYAEQIGVRLVVKSRKEAVSRLIKGIASKSDDEILKCIEHPAVRELQHVNGDGLEGWSEIILGNRKKDKEH